MFSDKVISKFKEKLPKLDEFCEDHTVYGITHLDIICSDGSLKQIGLFLISISSAIWNKLTKKRFQFWFLRDCELTNRKTF
jgi:hypothetical protein